MKANELMIGDWVYSTFSKLPCKVTYLKLYESGYGSVETTNVIGVKDMASLSPIPLTSEILEKNGFLCEQDRWWWKDFYITLASTKALTLVCNRTIQIKYVHKLQHALRLCEIEKEIIL